jgi:RNA polymerase primary sigma factor
MAKQLDKKQLTRKIRQAAQQRREVKASQRKTSVKKRSRADVTDHLSSYFRDLSEHGLLDPDEERHIASEIERHELLTWQRLLSYPSTVNYLLGLLEVRIENSLKHFRTLRKAAKDARSKRTKSARQKLAQCAAKTATQLRALDQDRKHIDFLIDDLDRLRGNGRNLGRGRLEFNPASQAFADYLRTVHGAQRSAAQLRDEFVRANLRLVVTMARRYDRGVMPLSDLIQEGNLGLMHAVSRFDYRRGLRFSTYACWWIRHAIGRALADKARTVRVPVHMIEAQQQLAKVNQQLVRELGRQPTRSEVSERANVPLTKLNQMNRYLLGQSMSLDGPVRNEEGRTLGEILPDPDSENWRPADDITNRALGERVRHLMGRLSPIEADVLSQRFGLADDEERTFREIGDQYKLSRERIRQIQNTALGKLRRALGSV